MFISLSVCVGEAIMMAYICIALQLIPLNNNLQMFVCYALLIWTLAKYTSFNRLQRLKGRGETVKHSYYIITFLNVELIRITTWQEVELVLVQVVTWAHLKYYLILQVAKLRTTQKHTGIFQCLILIYSCFNHTFDEFACLSYASYWLLRCLLVWRKIYT